MQSSGETRMMRLILAACAVVLAGGCMMQDQTAPNLAGPSGFGLSLTMAANPTVLPRDGSSQATITIVARDESGQPKPNVPLEVSVSPSTPVVALDAQTRSDGSARFLVTAPTPEVVAPQNNDLVLWVLPQGSAIANDAQNGRAQSVSINLLGARNATYPSPDFTFSPQAPKPGGSVVLDATKTTDEGVPCVTCTYVWDVEGVKFSGPIVSVFFALPGSYSVILKVTDVTGASASTGKVIEVEADEEMP
jgi:hypothetical protein